MAGFGEFGDLMVNSADDSEGVAYFHGWSLSAYQALSHGFRGQCLSSETIILNHVIPSTHIFYIHFRVISSFVGVEPIVFYVPKPSNRPSG